MITSSAAISGLALLASGALTLLSVPTRADADTEPTDRHEIPAFVLKRVELATGEGESPRPGAPSAARPAGVAIQGAIQ
jgi:hypothetical protein